MERKIKLEYVKDFTLTECSFREVWQSGTYHKLNKDDYTMFLDIHIDAYGKPMKSSRKMYRAFLSSEENISTVSGASWTPSLEVAISFADKYGLDSIFSMTIDKGTKAIHIDGNDVFPEDEWVINTRKVRNKTIKVMARRNGDPFVIGNTLYTQWNINGKDEIIQCSDETFEFLKRHCLKK